MFILGIIIVVVVAAIAVSGAIYISISERREREQHKREQEDRKNTAAAGREQERTGWREFYKSVGLGADHEDIKVRVYSPKAYCEQVDGESKVAKEDGFIAVLKAYKHSEDGWHEIPPDWAVEYLELQQEDYEADGAHGSLLLRNLPRGVPSSVRDVLDS
ncbi:MAG: hypothetical protein H0V53_05950 [Rubrobacter sp.]|nr:hypothetical protein [Rubrobacter sp.]